MGKVANTEAASAIDRLAGWSYPAAMSSTGPIITLTTDFGLDDWYVAAMKSVLLKACPHARLVDVTHHIRAGDVLAGSICLERAVAVFEQGAIHLAVVDPGVGSDRRLLVGRVGEQWVVCPDNGLITWTWRRHAGVRTHELIWRPSSISKTFHGRDVMAPAAGMLAAGTATLEQIGRPIDDPILLDIAPATPPARTGQIIYFDSFGNAITNVLEETVKAAEGARICAAGRDLGEVKHTYSQVGPGHALALIGSSGLLEIAVREGSARESLRLAVGDAVTIV